MPTISVPHPIATYVVYAVLVALCFGQWTVGRLVPGRYGRPRRRPVTELERQCDTENVASLFAPPPTGFVALRGIVNSVTGNVVPVDIEIHADDMDWLLNMHQESFLLDWKIDVAERAKGLCR